jgi:amidase
MRPNDRSALWQLSAMRSGRLDPRALMEEVLDRVAASDLNAVVSVRDRAALLAEAGDPRPGPLSGLPMAVKDMVDTAGIRTTYGHPAFADHVPEADAPLVARLKAAGAIVIGKTNVPEFALGSHTYNRVHGATTNPYDRTRSAGGSSGGAGAALATGLVALADGSDMMGSLRNPAAWNGVYGLRPTWGLVPPAPKGDPELHRISTDGPMARDPDDLELLLSVLAPAYRAAPPRPLRIGWVGDWGGVWPVEDGLLEVCEAALGGLAEPLAPPFPADGLWESWTTLRSVAMAANLKPVWTEAFAADSKPELVWEVERGRSMPLDEVLRASAIRAEWVRAAEALPVDVIALPATQCLPFEAGIDWPREIAGREMDSYHRWMEAMVPASLAGLPAISVPAGTLRGLPVGLQLVAKRGGDSDLIALARRLYAEPVGLAAT